MQLNSQLAICANHDGGCPTPYFLKAAFAQVLLGCADGGESTAMAGVRNDRRGGDRREPGQNRMLGFSLKRFGRINSV